MNVYPINSIENEDFLNLVQSNEISANTNLRVLIVLIELPDDPHHPTHTVQFYEDLFFSTETNSVNQYFQNVTYRDVTLEGEVLGWIRAKHGIAYYGAGGRLENVDIRPDYLVNESRTYCLKEGKNPENYDLFVIIHSGDGQEYSGNSDDIWSHKFDLRRFGLTSVEYSINHEFISYVTPSHELGHELYFPDLYDHANNFKQIFVGPYCLMAYGEGHISIWQKYYSHVSRTDSPQFLTDAHRLQISNYSDDTFITVNPIAITEPSGIMWLELGWNSSGFTEPQYGRGWTVSVRENLDYDRNLPKHGVVISKIQVGPRNSQIQTNQLIPNVYPSWEVIDAHPETSGNKEDAAFSLSEGDIGTYISGKGWAVQLIEKYNNLSYSLRVTNEKNIPKVEIIPPSQPIRGIYNIMITISGTYSLNISQTEISIDNGPWQRCTPSTNLEGTYQFVWDTTQMREGDHIIRARASDSSNIPYVGYSSFLFMEVDNTNGTILVVDDDLGRTSENSVLSALDDLGYFGQYDILSTSSLSEAEITAEELRRYKYVIWVGNPEITPISNSHINSNEFKEIKKYLESSTEINPSRIIFLSNYNIFDFSNQDRDVYDEIKGIFRAQSPTNFRAPVSLLRGQEFLKSIAPFTLGPIDSLRKNRSSDGEVVTLLSGAVPILRDEDPEFLGYDTKGYYVDNGEYKLVNFLFQPELVPGEVLTQLLEMSLKYLDQPNNSTLIENNTSSTSQNESSPRTGGIDAFHFIGMLTVYSIILLLFSRKYLEKK